MRRVAKAMLEADAQTGVPLTTKGDVLVHDGTALQRLPVGADGQVLTASAAAAPGVAWANGTAQGVGALVGDLRFTARPSPPAGWLLCDGRAVSRATYADLFAAIGTAYGFGDGGATFNLPNLAGRLPMGAGTPQPVVVPITAVDTASGTLTVAANDVLRTGTAATFRLASGALVGPTNGGTVYCVRVDATHVKLAASRAASVIVAAGDAPAMTLSGYTAGTMTLEVAGTARARGDVGGEEGHTLTVDEMPAHRHAQGKDSQAQQNGGSEAGGATAGGYTSYAGGSGEHNNLPPYTVGTWLIYAGA